MELPFEFQAEKIIEEGRTTQSAIDCISAWLKTTNLPQLQEEFIVLFLISCTNDIEATKKTIEAYFRIKNGAPQVFNGLDLESEDIKKIRTVAGINVMCPRINQNTAVVFANLINNNYRYCDNIGTLKLGSMMLNLTQIYNPPDDVVIVIDAKGLGLMHLTCIKIGAVLSYLDYVQEAMPLRIRAIHILNTNYVFEKFFSLIRRFIKSELINNINLHSPNTDMDLFFEECVPKKCLPQEYGGDLPSISELTEETLEELRKIESFFKKEEELRNSCKT